MFHCFNWIPISRNNLFFKFFKNHKYFFAFKIFSINWFPLKLQIQGVAAILVSTPATIIILLIIILTIRIRIMGEWEEWKDERMKGWMNEWMNEWIPVLMRVYPIYLLPDIELSTPKHISILFNIWSLLLILLLNTFPKHLIEKIMIKK